MKTIPTLFGEQVVPEPRRDHAGRFTENTECSGPLQEIKNHFELGMSLTVKQAWKLFGTSELRKAVCRLKEKGMNITSTPYIENGRVAYHIYKLAPEKVATIE